MFSRISIDFQLVSNVFHDFQGFSRIVNGCSRKTGPVLDSLRSPSAPWGWMLNDEQVFFSLGASSKNRTSVPAPSAAIGGHRQPSGPIGARWVGVKRGYGSPPSNSPRLSILVIYKVEVVGVVYCSHTPEESAD